MKNEKNSTEAIFQKIASSVNNSENMAVKEVTPKTKQPNKNKSLYDIVMDTLEKETKGGNENEK